MIKLLLIEDDVNLSYIIKSSLEEIIGNYEVVTASNGEEGLRTFLSCTPDVIVTDMEMPVMNGMELVRRIRELDAHIPIVFATGKTSARDVTSGYGVGANNYIKKPFLPEELDAHIQALLELKSEQNSTEHKARIYLIGKYIFKPEVHVLEYENVMQKLTLREVQILELLCENMGQLVLRKNILDRFWDGDDYFTSRSLDVFISKIRGYLSQDTSVTINNIKGAGLTLVCE